MVRLVLDSLNTKVDQNGPRPRKKKKNTWHLLPLRVKHGLPETAFPFKEICLVDHLPLTETFDSTVVSLELMWIDHLILGEMSCM